MYKLMWLYAIGANIPGDGVHVVVARNGEGNIHVWGWWIFIPYLGLTTY